MNLVDPDGRKIYFAEGVPEWYKKRFAATIQYMNEKGTSWIFKKLQDSDQTYYIDYDKDKIVRKGSAYNHGNRTIYWGPDSYIRTTNGVILFPATILAHEGAYALQHDKYGDKEYVELFNTTDSEYGRKNEREVITTTEQDVAKKHNDINQNEQTRTDHNGKVKILSEKNYQEILGNNESPKFTEEDLYLIRTYLLNIPWKKIYH